MSVVKYWVNPLWDWEWTFGFLLDDPSGQNYMGMNSFYPQPIPSTDLGILKAFRTATQGGGNNFLYQPPDYQVGGLATITAYSCTNDLVTFYGTNTAQLGQYALFSGGPLNGQNLQVLQCNPTFISVYNVMANTGITAMTGAAFCGQVLGSADANHNIELRHTIGSYPTLPLTGTPPASTLVTEAVQVIDLASLTVYAAGSPVTPASVLPADTIPGYQGLVLNFSGGVSDPITAAFNYWYYARFSEDTQDYENFLAMLWSCSSVRFEQDRL